MKTRNLSLCFGAALLVFGNGVQAIKLDKYFTANPIRVCDNGGNDCTTVNTFTEQTKKIYAQAGVAAVFLPTTQINNTKMLSIHQDEVGIIDMPGRGQSADTSTINMWFVREIQMKEPDDIGWGYAHIGANGLLINTVAVNSFGSSGRTDTVAHELGHNFGLDHLTFGAGGQNNLMTAADTPRSIPSTLADITPDGRRFDQLTLAQQAELRSSPFMKNVPEVIVDINGSTPHDSDNFFKTTFAKASPGVYLESLQIDLKPVHAFLDPTVHPPGVDPSPFLTSHLAGLNPNEISVVGNTDGSQVLTLNFADHAFAVGDSFGFGTDIDLFSNIDGFGATPEQLAGSLFTFKFSDGFGSTAAMSGTSFLADSTEVVNRASFSFDPSLLKTPVGFHEPVGHHGPIDAQPIPEPEAYAMMLAGLGLMGVIALRRRTPTVILI